MPNGHGGYPWMGGPILLLIAFAVVLFLPIGAESSHAAAREIVGIAIAALFGCRLAYHLHMRNADAYGGAYTNPDAFRRARVKFRVACAGYGVAAAWLGHLLLETVP